MLRGTVGNSALMRGSRALALALCVGCQSPGPIVETTIPLPAGRLHEGRHPDGWSSSAERERERRESERAAFAERVELYLGEHPETSPRDAELLRAGKLWAGQPEGMVPVIFPDAEVSEHLDRRGHSRTYRAPGYRVYTRDGVVRQVSRY